MNIQSYTKHYYIESDRFVSKIGGGMANINYNIREDHVYGMDINDPSDYENKSRDLFEDGMMLRHFGIIDVHDEVINDLDFRQISKFQEYDEVEKHFFFYHKDHLGSSTQISNIDANIIHHIEYMPSGEQFSEQHCSMPLPYKFNSKELDAETGLYYYGARYYTPEIGIWLSVDPMSDKYPSLSPFAYCALNPVILVDPDGREIWIIGDAAQAGFDELTHSTRIGLKFVDGQVSLSNPNTNRDELDGEDQLLFDAITSTSVKAEIITTKDPSNDGGEYHGTIYDDIDQTATSTNEVNVRNMTDLEGKHKAPRGSGIKHEATEGYNMGLKSIELKRSIQSAWSKEGTKTFYDRSGKPYNVNYDAGRSPDYDLYDAGHKTATPAPNERKNN